MHKLSIGVQETLKNSPDTVKPAGGKVYRFLKRTIDIVLSSFALLVLSPVFLIVALIIYIDDPGNPFFVQYRLTEKGKPFPMLKFRSMYTDAEARFEEVMKLNETDGLAFKMENDPRVTKVGDFIRKTSIDELPQLINIICGHMSIIGPRPPIPREVINYTPHQMNRLMVKGGLACYCQCSGRSDMPFDQWVESDIQYIKERSLWVDLKILIKTFIAVIKKEGAK
ncbi:MAG: sugar transferase [Ruminococcus sp.]|nr:sugar transferase [Ruminococcus sp.]